VDALLFDDCLGFLEAIEDLAIGVFCLGQQMYQVVDCAGFTDA
jgi:hypothetical protein